MTETNQLRPVKVLFLEDSAEDMEHAIDSLEAAGLRCDALRVCDEAGFRAALPDHALSLIVCDSKLQRWASLEAFALARALRPDLPIVIHSSDELEPTEGALRVLKEAADGFVRKRGAGDLAQQVLKARGSERTVDALRHALLASHRQAVIERLAGGIAHDFNNLLTVILGYTEMAIAQVSDPSACERLLKRVREAGERTAELTQKLLAFGRAQLLSPETHRLEDFVSSASPILRRALGEAVDLHESLDPAGWVSLDPGAFEQALLVLASNARLALPQGGKVSVKTYSARATAPGRVTPARFAVVEFADEGCGMEPQVLARLFEPFFTTRATGKGTGLGLATVQGFVEQSGGFVTADSTLNQGTSLRLHFPLVEEPSEKPPPGSGPMSIKGKGETVLLVEDESNVRDLILEVLEARGYRVLAARDGEAALRLLDAVSQAPDVVVTDVVMPRMNGAQLIEHLDDRWPGLPTVFISGYADTPGLRAALCAHRMFVPKPFDEVLLLASIRHVLRARRP